MYLFAAGSYVQSLEQRTMAEVITKVLYPADDHIEGKTLRIRQQYFFVSATAQSILRAHRARYGTVRNFAEHHVIQINDTHPTLIIPELMRLLLDDDGLGWDEAWAIVTACVPALCRTALERHGLTDCFEEIVFAQELGLEKRDPQVYRIATERLRVSPGDCTLYEDAPSNCAAARLAGMTVVGVYDAFYDSYQEEMRKNSDRYIRSFTELL